MRGETYAYADFNLGHAFPGTHYTVASRDNDAFLSTVRHGVVRSQEGRDCAEHADPVPRPIHPTLLGSYPMRNACKDLISAAELGARACIPMPVLGAAMATYQTALLAGHGSLDKGAMILPFE